MADVDVNAIQRAMEPASADERRADVVVKLLALAADETPYSDPAFRVIELAKSMVSRRAWDLFEERRRAAAAKLATGAPVLPTSVSAVAEAV